MTTTKESRAEDLGFPAPPGAPEEKKVGIPEKTRLGRMVDRMVLYVCGGFLVLLTLASIAAPWVAPKDPNRISPDDRKSPPSMVHPMGTDSLGRDMFSRVVHGSRVTLLVGIVSRTAALAMGVALGMAAAWFGGRVDSVIMRTVDSFLAFPGLLLAIGISMAIGPGLMTVILSLAVVGWADIARIARGCALEVQSMDYVPAARACGGGGFHIVTFHVLPNIAPTLFVVWAMGISTSIMGEASLSFLGLGVAPPTPSWGSMVKSGFITLSSAPWIALFPGFCISALVISINLLADRLNDALNPRLRKRS